MTALDLLRERFFASQCSQERAFILAVACAMFADRQRPKRELAA